MLIGGLVLNPPCFLFYYANPITPPNPPEKGGNPLIPLAGGLMVYVHPHKRGAYVLLALK